MKDDLPLVEEGYSTVHVSEEQVADVRERYDQMYNLTQSGDVRDALCEYYDTEHAYKFSVNGELMEPAVFADDAWTAIREDVNGVVGSLGPRESPPQDFEYVRDLIGEKAAIAAGDQAPTRIDVSDILYNGTVFAARQIQTNNDGTPVFDAYPADFFSYLSASHSMAAETYDNLLDGRHTAKGQKRDTYAPSYDAVRRCTLPMFIGTCAVTMLERADGSTQVLFGERPMTVVQAPGVYGTLPGGTVETERGYMQEEYDVEYTVLREFAEELLGESVDVPDDTTPREYGVVGELYDAVKSGRAHHVYTSSFIPMMAPRICIGTLLYLEDPGLSEALVDRMDGNWESREGVESVSLPMQNTPPFLRPDSTAPDAVGIFSEGLQAARDRFDVELGFTLNGSP